MILIYYLYKEVLKIIGIFSRLFKRDKKKQIFKINTLYMEVIRNANEL